MAKSFYGYVDRKGANQVDWSGIATQASESLKTIAADREQQKKDLDEVNRSLMSSLNDVEMGNNQTLNQMMMKGIDQSKQFLLMQNKLLKKGLLKPNDYSMSVQNQKDDWASFKKATGKLNAVYDDAMKRLADGTMSGEEAFKKEILLKFANVQNKGMFVNPADGRMSMAELDQKGNLIKDPDKLMSMAAINDIMNERVEKFDVIGNVNKGVAKIGEIIKVIRKNGVLTLEDTRQNPMYQKAKNDYISSMVANPKSAASVLADYLGGYEFTYDRKKAGGNTIYLKRDGGGVGQPELTADQEKSAREALDAAFETQVDKIEAPMPVFAPQRPLSSGGKDDDDMMFAYGNALEIAAGGPGAQGMVQAISKNPNSIVSNIAASPNAITIEFKDGRKPEIISRINQDGSPMTVDQVAQSIFPYLDPRATSAKVADVAGKYNQKYGAPNVSQVGSFGQPTYKGIDDITTATVINDQNVSVPLRSAIMNIDTDDDAAFSQVDMLAKKINPRISVSPSSKDGYVDVSFPGTETKRFPVNSRMSLKNITNYLEQLNQHIFKIQNENSAPTQTSPSSKGIMSKH